MQTQKKHLHLQKKVKMANYADAQTGQKQKMLKDILYWEMVFESQVRDYEKMIDYKVKKLKEIELIELTKLSKYQLTAMKLLQREIQLLVGFLEIMEELKNSYLIVTINNASLLWSYWSINQVLKNRVSELENESDFWLKYCYKVVQEKKEVLRNE
jgi:hypothetical protein